MTAMCTEMIKAYQKELIDLIKEATTKQSFMAYIKAAAKFDIIFMTNTNPFRAIHEALETHKEWTSADSTAL